MAPSGNIISAAQLAHVTQAIDKIDRGDHYTMFNRSLRHCGGDAWFMNRFIDKEGIRWRKQLSEGCNIGDKYCGSTQRGVAIIPPPEMTWPGKASPSSGAQVEAGAK